MDERLREMLAGYVDGELTDKQREAFEKELATNAELRADLEEFKRLNEVTGMAKYADLPEEVWENYWQSLYRKTERGFGWILFSIGAIVLACFGLYHAFYEMYVDPSVPLWMKIGVSTLTVGAVILLVSYCRERLFAYNRERYREVNR